MKVKLVSYYSIFIGISIIAMWTMILMKDSPAEGKTELSFHLFSEFFMAFLCLISGIFLLKNKQNAKLINVAGLGMVTYSVLNAAGYYGEKNDSPMMYFFIILFFLTLIALFMHIDIRR